MEEIPPCSCPEPVRGTLPDEFLQHVQKGDLATIEAWLAVEDNVNSATGGGQTLLSAACIYNQEEVVRMLLKNRHLHLNTKHRIGTLGGMTPFCIAAYKGLHNITLALLESAIPECQLNIEATTNSGKSAIRLAAEKKHWDVVDSLSALNNFSLPAEDSAVVTNLAKFANKFNVLRRLQRLDDLKEESSIPASERVYKNDTSPRGLVLILNYKFKGHPKMERKGTEGDVALLEEVFREMNYVTEVHPDLSLARTNEELVKLCKQERLEEFSCLIVVVLSHGEDQSTFSTADLNPMAMDELLSHFASERCPFLKDKPKLFLLQFCRGGCRSTQVNFEQRPKSDIALLKKDAFTDMLYFFAAQEGCESYRFEGQPQDPFTGTPFIQSFCHVLRTKGHMFLDDFLREFIDEYNKTFCGQPAEIKNLNFRKRFCFNPRMQ